MIVAEQARMVLTAHPLQRIGAHALARLAGAEHPEEITPDGFHAANGQMTDDAIRAALVLDSKRPDGFWLKTSRSFFPNSRMNHLSNAKRSREEMRERITAWREQPAPAAWPGVACVLCGRSAVSYYGKLDVPLMESELYRNTTPRGHEGTALCWPCMSSFYALPYGCWLTGGPSIAVHSWDDEFLRKTVRRQVRRNQQIFEAGKNTARPLPGREVLALRALRRYEERVNAGVELLVFSNDNRGQSLDRYSLGQPLAEWLRERAHGSAFGALLRAHRTAKATGAVGLARNAFREPHRIVGACAHYLAAPVPDKGMCRPVAEELAKLVYSYVNEVMGLELKELDEVKAAASRIGALLSTERSGGKLKEFYSQFREPRRLRGWLQRQAVYWAVKPPPDAPGPLMTTRCFELLFDPGMDSYSWFYRQLLLVAVLEDLHRRGWRPVDADAIIDDLAEDVNRLDDPDRDAVDDEEGQ